MFWYTKIIVILIFFKFRCQILLAGINLNSMAIWFNKRLFNWQMVEEREKGIGQKQKYAIISNRQGQKSNNYMMFYN